MFLMLFFARFMHSDDVFSTKRKLLKFRACWFYFSGGNQLSVSRHTWDCQRSPRVPGILAYF